MMIVSCSNITKEKDMTNLYNKLKERESVPIFNSLTPDAIDKKLENVTSTSVSLDNIKVDSVLVFKVTISSQTYWGKVLVTKVESDKFFFQYVLYKPDKSQAIAKKNQNLQKNQTQRVQESQIIFTTTMSNNRDISVSAKDNNGNVANSQIVLWN